MKEIFRKLIEEKIIEKKEIPRLQNRFQKDPVEVLMSLGVSKEKISHYLSFRPTQAGFPCEKTMPKATPLGKFLPDQYEILAEIGIGGMGRVYKAYDNLLNREVAIKVILEGMLRKSIINRFHREIKICAELDHPGIAKIYQAEIANKMPYIVMEYIEGIPLLEYFETKQSSLQEKLDLFQKICQIVDYAHKKQIIHRDIKPSNVLVRNDGSPVLLDFGVARTRRVDRAITRTGEVVGTPQYMSFEQLKNLKTQMDHRVDIYSLGAVLYHILTGKPPLEGNPMEILYQTIHLKSPPRASQINTKIPITLEKICSKALARKKEYRYFSAKLFAKDIENYLGKQKTSVEELHLKDSIALKILISIIFIFGIAILWNFSKPKKNKKMQKNIVKSPPIDFDEKKYKKNFQVALNSWMKIQKKVLRENCFLDQNISSLHRKLSRCSNVFQKILKNLEKNPSKSLQKKSLENQLKFCLKAISVEMKNSFFQEKKFRKALRLLNFPKGTKILFQVLLVRQFIHQKKWKKACKACDDYLYRFPWVVFFYQLRSFARVHTENLKGAMQDILSISRLEPFNFEAFRKVTDCLLENGTHFEYQLFLSLLINYQIENFQPMRRNYQIENFQAIHDFQKKFLDIEIKKLWKISEEKKELSRSSQKSIKKSLLQQQRVKDLLTRYSVFQQNIYASEIRNMGEDGIKSLQKILESDQEKEILKFLAAQMLLRICNIKAFYLVKKIANGTNFPANFLAKFVMKKTGFRHIGQNIPLRKIEKASPFYRILYTFFQEKQKPIKKFLFDKDPFVSIAAAYNLVRVFHGQIRAFYNQKILKSRNNRLLSLLKNSDPKVRSLALLCLWKYDQGIRKKNLNVKLRIAGQVFNSNLKNYGKTLVQGLRDKDLKQSALQVIWKNSRGLFITKRKNPNLKIFIGLKNQLKKMLKGNFKYHAGISLAFSNDFEENSKILRKTKIMASSFFSIAFFFSTQPKKYIQPS